MLFSPLISVSISEKLISFSEMFCVCFYIVLLQFDEHEDHEVNILSTDKLKLFNSRRKWAVSLTITLKGVPIARKGILIFKYKIELVE